MRRELLSTKARLKLSEVSFTLDWNAKSSSQQHIWNRKIEICSILLWFITFQFHFVWISFPYFCHCYVIFLLQKYQYSSYTYAPSLPSLLLKVFFLIVQVNSPSCDLSEITLIVLALFCKFPAKSVGHFSFKSLEFANKGFSSTLEPFKLRIQQNCGV